MLVGITVDEVAENGLARAVSVTCNDFRLTHRRCNYHIFAYNDGIMEDRDSSHGKTVASAASTSPCLVECVWWRR